MSSHHELILKALEECFQEHTDRSLGDEIGPAMAEAVIKALEERKRESVSGPDKPNVVLLPDLKDLVWKYGARYRGLAKAVELEIEDADAIDPGPKPSWCQNLEIALNDPIPTYKEAVHSLANSAGGKPGTYDKALRTIASIFFPNAAAYREVDGGFTHKIAGFKFNRKLNIPVALIGRSPVKSNKKSGGKSNG